jgi:hypothetical protein
MNAGFRIFDFVRNDVEKYGEDWETFLNMKNHESQMQMPLPSFRTGILEMSSKTADDKFLHKK